MNPRRVIGDWLWLRTIRKHRSRMGWRMAPPYTRFWDRCRATYGGPLPSIGELRGALDAFRRDGITAFKTAETAEIAAAIFNRLRERERTESGCWLDDTDGVGNRGYAGDLCADFPEIEALFDGPLGVFLRNYFGCDFGIFFATLYKSSHIAEGAAGSARWHSDSGPGSCVNVMFYLHDTDDENGALSALPWRHSVRIFAKERRAVQSGLDALKQIGAAGDRLALRDVVCDFYEETIAKDYPGDVVQPTGEAGLVVPFLNNTIHRGGYPAAGRTRHAIIFHCYPADRPLDFARRARDGMAKTASFPVNPADISEPSST